MTNKTVLSDEAKTQMVSDWLSKPSIRLLTDLVSDAEQAVLQSPEIQQLEKRLQDALDVLHEIGSEIQEESEGDAWRLSNIARDEYERQKSMEKKP
ncbi:hypothetical protein E4695_15120 [Alcaligenaceae bacterium 429]|nr:hypothetical protein E4695_15120 [Alcaligenaceae bacterium 429]